MIFILGNPIHNVHGVSRILGYVDDLPKYAE